MRSAFNGRDLGDPLLMALPFAERRGKPYMHDFLRQLAADDALSHRQHIAVIMFTTTELDDDGKACEFFINFTKKNKEEETAI